jgi:predicted TIM-barrel enzyme
MSTVAMELAKLDADRALEVVDDIADPAAKARALREISAQIAETDPELAEDVLADAVETARDIEDHYDRAWALRESALAPAADAAQARELLAEAEEAAGQIEGVEPQAFAQSDIAVAWATLDLDEARAVLEVMTDTSDEYPEPLVAALVGMAERISASNPKEARVLLEEALAESERVLDTYERAQAVNAVVGGMTTVDNERAEEIALGIEDPYLQGDALRLLAVTAATADADDAVSLAEAIEPRFIRVQALIAIGDEIAKDDPEKAVSIFEQALSEAGELDDTYPLGLLASAWAPLDPVKALEIADRVEDDADRVQALTDIAVAMQATNPEKAEVIFETAQETAQSIKSDDDPFAAATALRHLATVWSPVNEAEAGLLCANAFELAAAVPLVEPNGS